MAIVKTALVVISDRANTYLPECLDAVREYLPRFDKTILVDDSGGDLTRLYLNVDTWFDEAILHPERRGLAAAVNSGWSAAAGYDFLFHLEEDMVLTAPVMVDRMANILAASSLAQVALKRKSDRAEVAWHGHEHTLDTPDYREETIAGEVVTICQPSHPDHVFTLNPCLIPHRVFSEGWPSGNEEAMTQRCVTNGWQLGYWGSKTDPDRCFHIGEARSAGWKL